MLLQIQNFIYEKCNYIAFIWRCRILFSDKRPYLFYIIFSRINSNINTCLECEVYAENKKKFKLRIYYHFLSKYGVSSCELVTICAWYINYATCIYEIGDSRRKGYTNSGVFTIRFRYVIDT